MNRILLLISLTVSFSSAALTAQDNVCLINSHYPRIQINGETVVDNGGAFNSKCKEMDCLIETAKKLITIGQCSRLDIGSISEYEERECIIHRHYPRITREGNTLYDGGGRGKRIDTTDELIDLSLVMKEVDVCTSIRIE